jgi:Rod binding domain-containing protein
MTAVPPAGLGGLPPSDPRAELHKMSRALEGVFVAQLFQAMRATVPEESTDASPGREMFTAMLDERMADAAADRMHGGIGDALYHQLSRRLDATEPPATGRPHGSSAPPTPPEP